MTEVLEQAGAKIIDAISWDDVEYLKPGVDHKNGLTFVTLPGMVSTPVTVGRGKNAVTTQEYRPGLVCITSEGGAFPFNVEAVQALGYGFPDHTFLPKVRRWSTESIKEFIKGESTEPNPALLFKGLRSVYETYIEFAKEPYYDLMPLFVMGSYMFRLYKSIGYLHFNGTAASGKSQNLRILEALAFNTEWASSMSSAALYRSLAGHPGTVCIDEAEGFEGERGEELRRILNAGYLDGSTVKRAEKGAGDQFVVAQFESYGPKAIASIAPLDNVIGSRCLIVAMRPAIRKIGEFNKDDPRWARIRDRLYLWLMYHSSRMAEVIDRWNETDRYTRAPDLVGRQWQITQLYVTIADYIDSFDDGNRCNTMIAFFNEYFADLQKQQDASDRIRLVLRTLPRVLHRHAPHDGGYYHLKTIHEVVSEYLEDDAKEYYKTRSLGKHLDVLGFKKRRAHKQGQQVWLDPEQIRQEFRQRRVEPDPEDIEWLNGEVEYTHASVVTPTGYAPANTSDSVWAQLGEDD